MPTLQVPYRFTPRPYQLPLLRAFDSGLYKRFIQLWHRRSGKDKLDLNIVIREMQAHVGTYYYFYPTYAQGKKALWEAIGKDGMPYIDHFPKELVEGKPNETEMKVRFKNGSLFQVIGTDDIDRVVGTNPRGVVFSEYSLQSPKAWEYIRPILRENGGWAIFNYTPRGKNHAFTLYDKNVNNPQWFVSKLTVDDTNILTTADIQEEIDAGMPEDMVQQEFYCSFTAAIMGSYYWKQYDEAEKANRFGAVPYDDTLPVYTVWDLGIADAMSIGFYQLVGREVHMIDYYEKTGEGFPHYAKVLQERGYVYAKHFAPSDIKARELSTGKTRWETAKNMGIRFEVVPDIGIQNGIDAGRSLFKRLWVDSTKCADWLNLIPQYTKEYDEDLKIFKDKPLHDWTSHGADMYRYASVVINKMTDEERQARVYYPQATATGAVTNTQTITSMVMNQSDGGGHVRYQQHKRRGYKV